MPFENLTELAGPPIQAPVATQDLHVVELPNSRRADPSTGSGAGHGGSGAVSSGGAPGGANYDSVIGPTFTGSGGGAGVGSGTNALGGSGGGVVRLTVSGNLLVDGNLSANGTPGIGLNSGGGSGGSVWLTAGTLSGSGRITANGGAANGSGGGGGGGGRIALYFGTNNFAGVVSAVGGGGFAWGGAGTIYLQPNIPVIFAPFPPLAGELIVDNGGPLGATTPLTTVGSTVNLTVKGGAIAGPFNAPLSIRQLIVASNSWLLATNRPQVTASVGATVLAGGGITADRAGSPGGQGSGAGGTLFSTIFGITGGGGGHGGFGSASVPPWPFE